MKQTNYFTRTLYIAFFCFIFIINIQLSASQNNLKNISRNNSRKLTAIPVENKLNLLNDNEEDLFALEKLFSEASEKQRITTVGGMVDKLNTKIAFVILCHVKEENHNQLWRRCYDSIRQFYPNIPVIIIDDNSPFPISNISLHHTRVIRSQYPGSGELLPYYYFLQNKWVDKIVFLHDSMFLKRPFTNKELSTAIKFHWHFDLHNWDDDQEINFLLSHLKFSEELIDYNTNKKDLWYGCFGVASIIDLQVIRKIEKKYALTARLKEIIKTRNQRMALERIFGIIMFKEGYVNKENCSSFGRCHDIPYFYSCIDENTLEELKETYPGAILKTWHGR